MTKKIVSLILGFWLSVGALSFLSILVCHLLARTGLAMASSTRYLPLGELSSFAVDGEANILCYTKPYRRLQIFDKEGKFLRGWFVNTTHYAGEIWVDANDCIHLATNIDKHFVFDRQGDLLGVSKEEGIYEGFRSSGTKGSQHRDDRGNVYERCYGPLRSQIVRFSPSGQRVVVVSDPFYLCPFRGMFSMLVFFLPPFLIMFVRAIVRNKTTKGPEQPEKTDLRTEPTDSRVPD